MRHTERETVRERERQRKRERERKRERKKERNRENVETRIFFSISLKFKNYFRVEIHCHNNSLVNEREN